MSNARDTNPTAKYSNHSSGTTIIIGERKNERTGKRSIMVVRPTGAYTGRGSLKEMADQYSPGHEFVIQKGDRDQSKQVKNNEYQLS